ncbi:GntR family transcriptional regulator [Tsukamurella soli]|uniref:GntR family transcriptional regulator n=1 Tax=Tsukamurella soli TaxID=644556 RepID=A0ABP8JMX3_9ACTN
MEDTDVSRGGSLADAIADELRADILSGRLASGVRLVEEALARRFGVSRMPVREALTQLDSEGFLTTVRHKGATVSTTLRKDSRELLQVRRGLEVLAAQLAAENRGGAVAGQLADATGHDPTGHDAERAPAETPMSFHELVAVAAGNDQLREMLTTLNRRVAWGLGHDQQTSVTDHSALVSAILSGASVQAGYLMDEHLRRDERRFNELYDLD